MPDDQYQWDVQQMEDNVFRVNFPSRSDLVKAQNFGKFCVPKTQITLSFDFWRKDVEPVWTAEEVWVRVHGFPPFALDEILALWGFVDIFGETTDIDIPYTRANNVLRIRISCLDPALIPTSLDVKIRNDFFRLRFEVEGFKAPTTNEENLSEDAHKDDDMDHDGPNNNSGDNVDREVKRKKNEEESKDTDYEPLHPAPSTGTSMAISPFKLAQNSGTTTVQDTPRYDMEFISSVHDFGLSSPKCLDSFFSAAANLDVVDGHMAYSTPDATKLHDLGQNLALARRDVSEVLPAGLLAKEAAVATCTPRSSIGTPDMVVHGACDDAGRMSIRTSAVAVHGACDSTARPSAGSPGDVGSGACDVAARTMIGLPGDAVHGAYDGDASTAAGRPSVLVQGSSCLGTPMETGTATLSPVLGWFWMTNPSSLDTVLINGSDLPMGKSKRTYVHTITPKLNSQTNTRVSSMPMLVKDRAEMGTTKSTRPGIMTPPVSSAFSSEEVIAFGGIKSQEARGIRASGRLGAQPNTDATQMEKAMLLAQRRNEMFVQGNSQPHSILNFSDAQIIHNAIVLGVSMGTSLTEHIDAAHIIKENEFSKNINYA
jgi:hypothetical protein